MTETKAPSPLPETLPAGTRYSMRHPAIGCFPNGATLTEGGRNYTGYIVRDDGSESADGCVAAAHIDWSSVPTPAQPVEPKGDEWKVGDRAWHTMGKQECVLVEQNPSASMRGAWFAKFGDEPDEQRVPVLEMFLRRLSPQPTGEGPSVAELRCSGCLRECDVLTSGFCRYCYRATAEQVAERRRANPFANEPVATPTPKRDPYRAASRDDADVAAAMVKHDAITAKRRRFTADTLRDLDRPMLKLGGRFGKRVEMTAPSTWPEGSDHE